MEKIFTDETPPCISEWNEKYPQFPITRLIEEICRN